MIVQELKKTCKYFTDYVYSNLDTRLANRIYNLISIDEIFNFRLF